MRYLIYGIVQGVGFRPTVFTLARSMALRGFVRNNGSNVEVCVDRSGDEFITQLTENLPPLANIERVEKIDQSKDLTDYSKYPEFEIVPSTSGTRSSSIPVDTALCDPCVHELLSQEDRRYLYPFTNCTDCGARYSVIADVPYDRKFTSMAPFPPCSPCSTEYSDPGNRRLHAQTISCPTCGPAYTLYDSSGSPMQLTNPFAYFTTRLEAGKFGILKSWGGMHILASLDSIPSLRERYGRETKPFALMLRDIRTIEKYTYLSDSERKLLQSPSRPILLLRKKRGFDFLDEAAPGLDSVGVMLPYTGAHHILFHHFKGDGFVATSANLPGEAMITSNKEVFSLGMDINLLHNREIVQRVDDSLIKVYPSQTEGIPDTPLFIRRSRGFVPTYLELPFKRSIIAVGPERNVTGAMVAKSRLFLTQYIGNTRNYSNLLFLESSLRHLLKLTGAEEPNLVVRDLHPGYATNRVARELAYEFGAETVAVQHHHAHAASLLMEHGLDEMVTLTLDGTGYGPDATVWGGEVLWTNGPDYQRIATLERMPMPGSDLAVRDPRRMVFALGEITGYHQPNFTESEEGILRASMRNSPRTTSMGRVLDSLTCLLTGYQKRTYDGEPAMRLEPYLEQGNYNPDLISSISSRRGEGGGAHERDGVTILDQVKLFGQLFEIVGSRKVGRQEASDLAHTFVRRIMEGYVTTACDHAESKGIRHIGLTGGVAYSLPLIRMAEELVNEREMKLVLHQRLPPGDGGISAGQVYVAGMKRGPE